MASNASPDDGVAEALVARGDRMLAELRATALGGDCPAHDAIARRLVRLLDEPRLPPAFGRALRAEMAVIELQANIMGCDVALRCALTHRADSDPQERRRAIGAARAHLRRAGDLGAGEDFKRAAEGTIETMIRAGGSSAAARSARAAHRAM